MLLAVILGFFSGQGVVLGSHRGYSHKSYKATKTLQLLLVFFHTMSGQVRVHKNCSSIDFNYIFNALKILLILNIKISCLGE